MNKGKERQKTERERIREKQEKQGKYLVLLMQ